LGDPCFEYVDGAPPRRPWQPDELRLVTDALAQLAPLVAKAPDGLELQPSYSGSLGCRHPRRAPSWIQVQAGDALAALGDLDGAESHLRVAVGMAEDADDLEARYDALDRLRRLGRSRRRRDGAARPVGQRRQPTRRLSTSQRKRRSRRKR
jgi:hypothetical protein